MADPGTISSNRRSRITDSAGASPVDGAKGERSGMLTAKQEHPQLMRNKEILEEQLARVV
jgi:hypothetical protein